MDYVPLHKTRMGEKFFCKTMPDLIRAIERLNNVLTRIADQRESADKPQGD